MDMIKLRSRSLLLLGFLVCHNAQGQDKDLPTWTTEQRLEKIKIVESQNNKSYFCDCSFDINDKVDPSSCQAELTDNSVSWTSLIPINISNLDKNLSNDLHLLHPIVKTSNIGWANIKTFGEVSSQSTPNACGLKVDKTKGIVEPPTSRKGDIARLYFYLQHEYGIQLSAKQTETFNQWDRADPPSQTEIERNNWLYILQEKRIYLPGTDYMQVLKKYRSTDFIARLFKSVDQDNKKIDEMIANKNFDPEKLIFRVNSQLQYNREYVFAKWIEDRDPLPLLEPYSMYKDLIKHNRFYFDQFNSEGLLKVFSLAILFGDKELATFLARQIILSYDVNEEYYDKTLTMDLLFRMSQVFLGKSDEASQFVDNKYAFFKGLFSGKSSIKEFSSALERLSNKSIPAFGYTPTASQLFQIEILAVNHLGKTKIGKAANRLPYLAEHTRIQEIISTKYSPTHRQRMAKARIDSLPKLTDLYLAAINNDSEKANQLMQAGASVNQIDRFKRTPLYIAVTNKNFPLVKHLTKNQDDLRDPAWTEYHTNALHYALKNGLDSFAKHLITQGVPVDFISAPEKSRYALKAFFSEHRDSYDTQLFELILQNGAKSSKSKWSSPLDEAISKPQSTANAKELFNLLTNYGYNPQDSYSLNYDGVVIYPELVKFLINKEVNVNNIWVLDMSPLHAAIENNAYESVKLLLEAGADLNHKNYDKQTPLEHAKYRGYEKIAKLLKSFE